MEFFIIKTNVLPRFEFLSKNRLVTITPNILKQWDKLLSTFIWGGRNASVKLKTIKQCKHAGGLA